mmetsp:Transcript_16571/g.31303  ORF Transcript_16571/g.31303 Transcript_16571/m.31303 type:complete len:315 (+) Transcript_16571:66-1010(+)
MAEGKLTLKVCYKEEVRRLKDWPQGEPSFEDLQRSALALFDLSEQHCVDYQDGEGHLVSLTEEKLPDVLQLAAQFGLLRLNIKEDIPQANQFEPPASAEVAPAAARPVEGGEAAEGASDGAPVSGWSCFKQQVVDDFQTNYRDMQEAFKSSGDRHPALNVVGKVAGFTAGVCASARLIPLHGTKLAARGVASAAHIPVADEAVVPPDETPLPEPGNDVEHFKQQVIQDFQVGRKEIQASFGYFTGSPEPASSETPRLGKDVIPAVASTVAGLTIASTLVPLRAARLVVASLASRREDQQSEPGTGGPHDAPPPQ